MGLIRAEMAAGLLLCCCMGVFVQMATAQPSNISNYQDIYETQWGGQHIQLVINNGAQINLILDNTSGAGFYSKQDYTYGYFSIAMKLISGYSAGTVSTFYLTSGGDHHDEIDFEFLGNVTGQPYSLNTNLFSQGKGMREQVFTLWFDPTADFHTYTIVWNHAMITWLIDGSPIRVFQNLQTQLGAAVPYPSTQQVRPIGSIFDGYPWATKGLNGTSIGVDYSYAPFVSSYSKFVIDGCVNDGVNVPDCATNYQDNWWEGSQYTNLTSDQITTMTTIQNAHRYYDYCKDTVRFPSGPNPECAYNYN